MSKKGFTLVELLVVISIIAILSALGMIVYTKFLQNARDGKRQSDLRSIQSALEQHYADQRAYPDNLGSLITGKVYMTTIPTDPKGSAYCYVSSGCAVGGLSYCLGASTEGTPPPSDPSCTCTGSNYCVTRP